MTHNSINRKTKNQGGFTLIEVMVAMVLFAITIAGVYQMLSHSYRMSESARDLNRITQILQYQVENLRGNNWSILNADTGDKSILVDEFGIPGATSESIPFGWQDFSLNQTTTIVSADYIEVALVAKWTDNQGRTHSQSFETSFAEDGLNAYYARSI